MLEGKGYIKKQRALKYLLIFIRYFTKKIEFYIPSSRRSSHYYIIDFIFSIIFIIVSREFVRVNGSAKKKGNPLNLK